MAKSLGQIHTVNYELTGSGQGDKYLLDCAGELTSQLGHMVRCMSNFKIVGIDAVLRDPVDDLGSQAMKGVFRFYAPTRGRVLAVREAYHAVRKAMKIKGIRPTSNLNYDFRPPLEPLAVYENGTDFKNAASIQFDYTTNAFVELAIDNNPTRQVVFDMWNAQLEPRQGQIGVPDFSTGYDVTLGGITGSYSSPTTPISPDYVINEGVYMNSPEDYASTEYEEIPFQLVNSSGDSAALDLNWRPDPALYLSVMLGQFELQVIEFEDTVEGEFFEIDVAIHVAGWTSIASDRKRKKGKSHGKKGHSKK